MSKKTCGNNNNTNNEINRTLSACFYFYFFEVSPEREGKCLLKLIVQSAYTAESERSTFRIFLFALGTV